MKTSAAFLIALRLAGLGLTVTVLLLYAPLARADACDSSALKAATQKLQGSTQRMLELQAQFEQADSDYRKARDEKTNQDRLDDAADTAVGAVVTAGEGVIEAGGRVALRTAAKISAEVASEVASDRIKGGIEDGIYDAMGGDGTMASGAMEQADQRKWATQDELNKAKDAVNDQTARVKSLAASLEDCSERESAKENLDSDLDHLVDDSASAALRNGASGHSAKSAAIAAALAEANNLLR